MKITSTCLKNRRIIFLLNSIALIAVCCKTNQPVSTSQNPSFAPVESDVSIAQTHWHETTLDILNQGYYIYRDKCNACHDYKKPQDFGVHEWWVIVHKMGRKANLDETQDTLLLHFILTKRQAILGDP